jgi:ribosomal silencing factor RsfS
VTLFTLAGNIIVHFFTEDEREYYNLEELWGGKAPKKRQYGPYGELLD